MGNEPDSHWRTQGLRGSLRDGWPLDVGRSSHVPASLSMLPFAMCSNKLTKDTLLAVRHYGRGHKARPRQALSLGAELPAHGPRVGSETNNGRGRNTGLRGVRCPSPSLDSMRVGATQPPEGGVCCERPSRHASSPSVSRSSQYIICRSDRLLTAQDRGGMGDVPGSPKTSTPRSSRRPPRASGSGAGMQRTPYDFEQSDSHARRNRMSVAWLKGRLRRGLTHLAMCRHARGRERRWLTPGLSASCWRSCCVP